MRTLPIYKILWKGNYYDYPKLPKYEFRWNRHGRFSNNNIIHVKSYGGGLIHITYPFEQIEYIELLGWSNWESGMLPSQTINPGGQSVTMHHD